MRDSDGILSFVLAFIVIFLCYLAIRGIKNEWDKDKSANNVIVTEGIDLDIVNGEEISIVGKVLDFVYTSDTSYFEPGKAYRTEGFSVTNKGDEAIEYRVNISDDETVNKEKFREAFDFWLTTDPLDLTKSQKLTSFEGHLYGGEQSENYYIVVKMKETAGNEFQSLLFEGIGITVYAVQSNETAE